ncbi:hypothetical protein B0O80DRAFT_491190 [Mortierella sp. GBAus27b]|nr:hypothetical protein BGX31_009361 [Mortierella sp. GBA43]KAI8346306.1 hypothetical protein B0O80DRAFT_491190 [Mortierella sp. GBAus27b]
MPRDICILHYRIPDQVRTASTTQDQAAPAGVVTGNGKHDWMCQLQITEDRMIRGTLNPLPDSKVNRKEFQSCCSLQVAIVEEYSPQGMQLILGQRITSEHLFKRGIEFYLYQEDVWADQHYEFYIILSSYPIKLLGLPDGPHGTHTLALSESDPGARNIDPLVEMMTQFEQHGQTSDVEFRFVSKAGLVLDRLKAHYAILSNYPAFTEMMAQVQRNPHKRSRSTVFHVPVEYKAAFGRMLGFIYSGRLPGEGFAPRSDQWKVSFELTRVYRLDKCISSTPWVRWHTGELRRLITDENVLEIYFSWGYEYGHVVQLCVRHVADRLQVHFHGNDLGTYVMGLLKERYQGQKGYHEFQEALVATLMEMYAEQQQHAKHMQRLA